MHVSRLLLLAVLLGLAGCGDADPHEGDRPGTVHVELQTEIAGLDPARAQESTVNTCCLQIYDTLYEYHHLKRPYELVCGLAAEMPDVSEDGLTHTIPLKQGVLFHDDPCFEDGKGREMTADDVVFSIKRLMDAKLASPGTWILDGFVVGLDEFKLASKDKPENRTTYEDVEGLRATDRYTVQIKLKKLYPQLHWILAMPYTSVVPHEAIATYGDEFLNNPVGTGPFIVEEFGRTQRLKLRRNPTYREDYYPTEGEEADRAVGLLEDAGKRLPLADALTLTIYKEPQPRWLAFLQGHLDRVGIAKDQYDMAIDPATRLLRPDLESRGVRLAKTPQIEIIYDAFNMQHPVFGQPNGEKGRAIRRAMSLAYHESWARKHFYNNRVDPIQGLLVPEFPEFDPDFVNPWKRKPGETREEVLARARKILADAGYPGGEKIPPIYEDIQGTTTAAQFHAAMARDMREIGIDLRATRVTWPQMMNRLDAGDAEFWGLAWVADYPDAQNFFQLFYGPNKAPGPNAANYQNPEFDRLYELSATMAPGPERTKIYREMQRIVVEDCVWIFKFRRVTYDLMQPWLSGYKRSAMQNRFGKYLRVNHGDRREVVEEMSEPVLLPVWIVLGFIVVVLVVTLRAARHRVRPW